MRYACLCALVLIGSGCDNVPVVDIVDGGVDVGADASGELTSAGELEWVGEGLFPGSGPPDPPSSGWTSPPVCPTVHEEAHCARCWSHEDSGPTSLDREEAGDRFAHTIAIGDFNGDGYPDLAGGAPQEDTVDLREGVVQVLLGTASGFQPWQVLDDSDAGGPTRKAEFGFLVHAFDVNGDGYDDLAVGYPGDTVHYQPLLLFHGGPSGLTFAQSWELSDVDSPDQTRPGFGREVTSGDFDHDGDVDLAIAAPRRNNGGTVYVMQNDLADGGAGDLSLDYEIQNTGRFGFSMATTSDDLLVIASYTTDVVRTYDDGTLTDTFTSGYTPAMNDYGYRVEAGDLDGDGSDEIFIGGFADWVEVATSGGSSGDRIYSPVGGPGARRTYVAAIGDITRDGFADLVFVYDGFGNKHSVMVLEGDGTLNRSCWDASASPPCWFELDPIATPMTRDDLGERAVIEDVDGDGWLDLVLAAPYPDGGKIFVYAPPVTEPFDATLMPTQSITQETPLDASCEVCDVFDDGYECDGSSMICVFDECVVRACGDGWREPAGSSFGREGCDDGNALGGDLCSAMCTPTSYAPSGGESRPYGPRTTLGVDGNGDALLVWEADDGVKLTLEARRFRVNGEVLDASPIALGAPLALGVDSAPSVVGLSEGWVVAWHDPDGDGDLGGVSMRRVSRDGTLGAVQVATETVRAAQTQPALAPLSDGGFVLVYTDSSESLVEGPARRVLMRRFDGELRAVGDEVLVSSEPNREHADPVVASAGATVLVAWVDRGGPIEDPTAVRARRFDLSEGTLAIDADDLIVATLASEVSAAALGDGSFALVWRDGATDPYGDLWGQRVEASGTGLVEASEAVVTSLTSGPSTADIRPSVTGIGEMRDYIVVHAIGRNARGLSITLSPSATATPSELTAASALLAEVTAGDGSIHRSATYTRRGLWLAWSTGTDPTMSGAHRSVLAHHLAED